MDCLHRNDKKPGELALHYRTDLPQPAADRFPPTECCKLPWIAPSLPVVTNYLDARRKETI